MASVQEIIICGQDGNEIGECKITSIGIENPGLPLFEVHVFNKNKERIGLLSAMHPDIGLSQVNLSGVPISYKITYASKDAEKVGGTFAQALLENENEGPRTQAVAIQEALAELSMQGIGKIHQAGGRGIRGKRPSNEN